MRKGLLAMLAILTLVIACQDDNDFEFDGDIYNNAESTALLWVPAGWFVMGSDFSSDFFDGVPDEPFADEQPEHRTYVSAFWLEKHEVTNAQYRACVKAEACRDPASASSIDNEHYYTDRNLDSYPVVNITWGMAVDYCAWRDRRLPTEGEWEKAGRGDADERAYPWGWQEPTCGLANISIPRADSFSGDAQYVETCRYTPMRVGTFALSASPWGATEMAGNVAEWTADHYAADYYDAEKWPHNDIDPLGPPEGEQRVIRGGSFASTAYFARVSFRDHAPPETYHVALGFRCAKDASE